MREIVLPREETPKKLENFLKKEFPIGYVRRLFRKNGVRVNGRRAKVGDVVRGGDQIQLYIDYVKQTDAFKQSAALAKSVEVLYEDASLFVLNKPAGIAVPEGETVRKSDSLSGILEAKYREPGTQPQLVHRLDRDTSGVLLVAKNRDIAKELQGRFERGEVHKEYLCLIAGRPLSHEGKIDLPLPGREGNLVPALTRYRVLQRFLETTLVRVVIETGRLHQIRLHFAELGHPVIMDQQHGDFRLNKRFRKQFGLKRQFLHAEKLALNYAGHRIEWTAPLPKDLSETLRKVSAQAP